MMMYILVKESIPNNLVPVITAHASLACFLKYEQDEEMQHWINSVFKKVVCKVTEVEFEKARQVEKLYQTYFQKSAVQTEDSKHQ